MRRFWNLPVPHSQARVLPGSWWQLVKADTQPPCYKLAWHSFAAVWRLVCYAATAFMASSLPFFHSVKGGWVCFVNHVVQCGLWVHTDLGSLRLCPPSTPWCCLFEPPFQSSFRFHGVATVWTLHWCKTSGRGERLFVFDGQTFRDTEHREAPFILEVSPVYWSLCCLKKFIAPSGRGATMWCLLKSTSGSNLFNSNQPLLPPSLQPNNPQGPITPHNCSFVWGLYCVIYAPNYRSGLINKFQHDNFFFFFWAD